VFTGIIEAVGRVAAVKPAGQSAALTIDAGGLDMSDVAVGDSIACNGVCLTVTSLVPKGFTVDVSQETLRVTAGFDAGNAINLEKSLRLSDRLGGHLVNGHVDGVGTVTTVKPVDHGRGRAPRRTPLARPVLRGDDRHRHARGRRPAPYGA